MLCERCEKREAKVHITKIINNEKVKLNLCEECAKEYQDEFSLGLQSNFPIHQFLTSIFSDTMNAIEDKNFKQEESVCPMCNLTYSRFANGGKVGCSKCYEHFQDQLEPLLKRIHGSTKHTGKFPQRAAGNLKLKHEIKDLKSQLQKLVAEENFEKAAEVRDKIKKLEKELENSSEEGE